MKPKIPYLNKNEIKALYYISETNEGRDKPATISEMVEETDWRQIYFTRSWKSMPELIDREQDGKNTRLKLTEKGEKVLDALKKVEKAIDDED